MKKAILAALCFMIVGFMFVNGTFALPEFDKVFQSVADIFVIQNYFPEKGGPNMSVDVKIVSEGADSQLFPGGTATQTSQIKNEGTGDVFFRFAYAVQYCDEASWDKLTISFEHDDDFKEDKWRKITVDGDDYMMKVFTYTKALSTQELASKIKISVSMDESVTSQEIARYSKDFLMMRVMAIEAEPFIAAQKKKTTLVDDDGNPQVDVTAVAEAALNAALPLESLNPF